MRDKLLSRNLNGFYSYNYYNVYKYMSSTNSVQSFTFHVQKLNNDIFFSVDWTDWFFFSLCPPIEYSCFDNNISFSIFNSYFGYFYLKCNINALSHRQFVHPFVCPFTIITIWNDEYVHCISLSFVYLFIFFLNFGKYISEKLRTVIT